MIRREVDNITRVIAFDDIDSVGHAAIGAAFKYTTQISTDTSRIRKCFVKKL